MIHIGFTGTQAGMTDAQAERVRELLGHRTFIGHHGLCIGADIHFDAIARSAPGFRGMVVHPCDLPAKQGRVSLDPRRDVMRPVKKPLVRNHDIVDEAHIMVATPKEAQMQLRSGTWTTVRYALASDRPTAIILPFGGVVFDGPAFDWLA